MTAVQPDGYVAPDSRGRVNLRRWLDPSVKHWAVFQRADGTVALVQAGGLYEFAESPERAGGAS